jgi:hypothetical protein
LSFYRNIGDAFLVVWKFPENAVSMGKDRPIFHDLRLASNYVDFALLAFARIFV